MPLRIGNEDVGVLKIGAEIVGVMKVGSEIIYSSADPPPATAAHTYSITVGAHGSGIVGYWFNNIGSIARGTYNLPNSVSAIVRQTMTGGGVGANLRFVLSSGGLTTNSIDQFPATIVTERAGTSITWTRPSSLGTVGQGLSANYTTRQTTLITTVFQNNTTVTVQLYNN